MVYHAYTKAFNYHSLLNIKPFTGGADGGPTVEPTKTKFRMEAFQQAAFAGKCAHSFRPNGVLWNSRNLIKARLVL